ncbi:hypothetical protein [Streptomyces sp. NBC_00454]|uniref:hypothetical protein n=1 Tax=Streptomyces sp. NBC_00454 TaxID=2975747 RepID=UPI0030E2F53E
MSLSRDPAAVTARQGGHDRSGLPKRRIGKYRFAILAVLFVSTAINYLDRSVLSIVAPDVSRDLGVSPETMGWLFSKGGLTGALPFVAALVGVLCGGSWSDWTVKRGIPGHRDRPAAHAGRGRRRLRRLRQPRRHRRPDRHRLHDRRQRLLHLSLLLIGSITIGGALSFLFLVDKVERIEA